MDKQFIAFHVDEKEKMNFTGNITHNIDIRQCLYDSLCNRLKCTLKVKNNFGRYYLTKNISCSKNLDF